MTRVLVIEDEKEIRENIIELLTLSGFEAQGASNGERGIKIMQIEQPDLVVCDIMMDGMDGFGVLQSVRNDAETADIPFIFLTALSSHDDLRLGMTSGADDYLTKPFSSEDLIDAIHARIDRLNKTQDRPTHRQTQLINKVFDQVNLPDEVSDEVTQRAMQSITDRIHRMSDDYLTVCDKDLKLERVTEQVALLAKMDANILSYERIVRDGDAINMYATWTACIKETIATLENADYVTVMTDENNLDAAVCGDYDALTMAFNEILINAFQHSSYNGVITIAQWATRDHAWFSVTDSGSGMSADHVRLLLSDDNFEVGLGLTLAKRIAEVHGGDLRIDSAPNQGTIVAIRLPLAKVEVPVHG